MSTSSRARALSRACVVLALVLALLCAIAVPASAEPVQGDGVPVNAAPIPTAAELDGYLAAHGSPMAGQGASFVSAGAAERLDPRLLVAIAGAESSFGQITCAPYNAWGYGCPNGPFVFTTWAEGIATVAHGLRTNYLDDGLTSVAQIQTRYAPSHAANDPTGLNDNWTGNVSRFLVELGGNPQNVDLAAAHIPSGVIDPHLLLLGPLGAYATTDFAFSGGEAPVLSPKQSAQQVATVQHPLHLEIAVTNSGRQTWSAANVRLRRVDIEPRVASAPYAAITGEVAPGGTATFGVDVAPAGSQSGSFTTEWRVEGPDGPFGAIITRTVTTRVDAFVASEARIVTAPPSLPAGGEAPVVVKFRNMGSGPWLRDGAQPVELGILAASGPGLQASGWLGTTVPGVLLEREVDPGEFGTFAFKVHAPDAPAADGAPAVLDLLPFRRAGWASGQPLRLTVQLGAGSPAPAGAAPNVDAPAGQ